MSDDYRNFTVGEFEAAVRIAVTAVREWRKGLNDQARQLISDHDCRVLAEEMAKIALSGRFDDVSADAEAPGG